MIFKERSVLKKKTKDLKNEIRWLKKEMQSAGCDKGKMNSQLKEFQEAMELGYTLQMDYESAMLHRKQAVDEIDEILEEMYQGEDETVQEALQKLSEDLKGVYHDCAIRKDDLDFYSTTECFRRMIKEYKTVKETMPQIMLRSELENIRGVLSDAADRGAPDFFALAYFYNNENKEELKDKENEHRNQYIESYLKEQFMEEFMEELAKAGVIQHVKELMQSYIYG